MNIKDVFSTIVLACCVKIGLKLGDVICNVAKSKINTNRGE